MALHGSCLTRSAKIHLCTYPEVAHVLGRRLLGRQLGRRCVAEILRPEEALEWHKRSVVRFGGLEEAAALELAVALSHGVVLKWDVWRHLYLIPLVHSCK